MSSEYNYSHLSGDHIRNLQNQVIQIIKSGTTITHTKFDPTQKIYVTQNSSFSNMVIQNHPHIQHYGFCSVPLAGSRSIILGMSGSNTNNAIIGTHDDRYQPQDLIAGEVALHDYQGQSISLKQNQIINITGQKTISVFIGDDIQMTITDGNIDITGNVQIDKDVTINGNLHVKGSITSDGDMKAQGTSVHTHTHTTTDKGSATSAPN
ncbi:phage baseplate assembly protein V [Gluconobacter sp. OJB]|uniref:phage baseplate assembly protein V n=1 Tax=Gluconobacter sp. OJB TaxID=3145196 RepID=UPI0031F7A885